MPCDVLTKVSTKPTADLMQARRMGRRIRRTKLRSSQAPGRERRFLEGSRTMNWDTVKGDWKQFRGKIKEQWGKLTDDDLDRIEGKRDQLLGAVQKRYGIARDEAEKQLNKFETNVE
jgi:uncharacterized protein YjbJ (UPF0337 family)